MRMNLVFAVLLAHGTAFGLSEDDYFRPIGRPPEAQKKMIKGGEGVPPLPLPATPLRRSERKREPTPATLIGKVVWGASADFIHEDGQTQKISDWNLVPADCQQLLKKTAHHLKMQYNVQDIDLNNFSGDPAELPVLYISGGRTLKLPDEQIALLRKYALSGGMIWLDAVGGSPYFYQGCVDTLKKAFPEDTLRRVPLDHPVFHMIADLEKVTLPAAAGTNEPVLEGVYVGCRLAVVVSRFQLGAGWDNMTPDSIKSAVYYNVQESTALGLNMVAYAVGYAELGRAHARPELVEDSKGATDEFVFAQVKHNGVWNTDPGGPGNLLRALAQDTKVKVTFRRKTVNLATDGLKDIQFLYMSGCHDMILSEAESSALRGFLARGGTLLIDNAQGLKTFDNAVRREIKKVLPGSEFQTIPLGHAIFNNYQVVNRVNYTAALKRLEPKLDTPRLEGIALDGDVRVIYSPYDLGGGWQGDEHAQGKGYSPLDATRLGMNMIMYAMTH